ncbi:isochorismatase [Bacillus atrophaeus]|nr:isochorismatase [Bacillus atrophaeus]
MSNLELLTPENSTLILIDFQPQMTFGVASIHRQTLMNNVMLLAKSAKTFNVPTILTTVETRSTAKMENVYCYRSWCMAS